MNRSLSFLRFFCFSFLSGLIAIETGWAISPDNAPAKDDSVEAELASFEIREDFEVSLFADESLGIANPIAIHWDPRGKLWVLCTLAYAQLKPGQKPDDKLFVLEDTDGDGRADKSTVFAGGLNMPMGFALGHGGVYLAQDTDLLFLKDTDGDDRADERKILLTGFGTGDTHQNISNLVLDAGGFLYFTQGLHTFSHVETPWGVARGESAGFWRFDPRTERLDPFAFPSMAGQNPCGAALDRWGALFIKSNGPHLCFATPALIPTTRYRELMVSHQVGQTPGKSMGADIVESSHLPDWIQGHAVIAGYFGREVSAIPLVEDGAGFAVSPPKRLLYARHPSFRPVDIRQGPDGAIYVVDWYNPIINHYQVSLRHPDRDYEHGRIWRLAAKGRAPVVRPPFESMGINELCLHLGAGEQWARLQARRRLSDHADRPHVIKTVSQWVKESNFGKVERGVSLVEAVGVLESLGAVSLELLDRLQASPEPRARAAAARILGRMEQALVKDYDSFETARRLRELARDPHPRPRLETIVACANLGFPGALRTVLAARRGSPDKAIHYAAAQAVTVLQKEFHAVSGSGDIKQIAGDVEGLIFLLETSDQANRLDVVRKLLDGAGLGTSERSSLLGFLGKHGKADDLGRVLAAATGSGDAALWKALRTGWERKKIRPSGDIAEPLRLVLKNPDRTPIDDSVRLIAIDLAGLWKCEQLTPLIAGIAFGDKNSQSVRMTARTAFARLAGKAAVEKLTEAFAASREEGLAVRSSTYTALCQADAPVGATLAIALFRDPDRDLPTRVLLRPFLEAGGGLRVFADALNSVEQPLPVDAAREILTALQDTGRRDAELMSILQGVLGIESVAPKYDPKRVQTLVKAVSEGRGDISRGKDIYGRAELSCVACHRVGDAGGVIGPVLTNVGAGMPLDQIVESLLWPDRQIKEGFQAVSLTTRRGKVITGYLEREGQEMLFYRNATAPWILPLEKKDIAERKKLPTLMPAGLTHGLTEKELIDLIAYLASLQG